MSVPPCRYWNGTYCKEGHTGILCAVCDTDWHRRGSSSICSRCHADKQTSRLWSIGLSIIIAIVIIVSVSLDLWFGWSRAGAGNQQLKLMVNCVQQLTVMTLFPVKWPAAVKELGSIFEGFSIDVSIFSP